MFDDNKQPVDIFADVEKSAPRKPGAVLPPMPISDIRRGASKLLLVIIVVLVLGIGGGVYAMFFRTKSTAPALIPESPKNNVVTSPVNQPAPAPQLAPQQIPEQPTVPTPEPTQPIQPPEQVNLPTDSDGDGLSDIEEAQLGTNPNSADTDKDGLIDYEEAKIYHTDPKNPDTDGDSFLDGQEVKGGYDPNGPGKLFTIPPSQK